MMDERNAYLAAMQNGVIPGQGGEPPIDPTNIGAAQLAMMPQLKRLAPGVPQGAQACPGLAGGRGADSRAYDNGFRHPDNSAFWNALRAAFGSSRDPQKDPNLP